MMMNQRSLSFLLLSAAAVVTVRGQPGQPGQGGFPPCYICGDEEEAITIPDFVVPVPGQEPRSCSVIAQAGLDGLISEDQCGFLPDIFAVPCGCEPVPDGPEDTDLFVSDVPSDMPSLAPSSLTSSAPTVFGENAAPTSTGGDVPMPTGTDGDVTTPTEDVPRSGATMVGSTVAATMTAVVAAAVAMM